MFTLPVRATQRIIIYNVNIINQKLKYEWYELITVHRLKLSNRNRREFLVKAKKIKYL